MENKPKITVITVCYNCVSTIDQTIRSVVEQTYENIEYIIIDGASTDGTLDVIKKYENRIARIVSEPDKGIYDAMNKGIALASGEWIHFRNSGDFFLRKDSVERFFEQPVADDVSVVHGNCLYYDETGWFEQGPPSMRVSYKKEIPVLHPAAFVRTRLQKAMPFDLQYRSSADYDFFFKCCEQGLKFEYRPIAIVAFARGGFSSNWKRAYYEDCRVQGKYNRVMGGLRVKLDLYRRIMRREAIRVAHTRFFNLILKKRREKQGTTLLIHSNPLPTDF